MPSSLASKRFLIVAIFACLVILFSLHTYNRNIIKYKRLAFVNNLILTGNLPKDGINTKDNDMLQITIPSDNSGFNYNASIIPAPGIFMVPTILSSNHDNHVTLTSTENDLQLTNKGIFDNIQNVFGFGNHQTLEDSGTEDAACINRFKANYTMLNGIFIEKNVSIESLPKDFDFTINPAMMCYKFDLHSGQRVPNDIFIMSMIHTAPNHFEHRDSIRETWGSIKSYFNYNIRLFFILGLTSNTTIQDHLVNESQTHGDIVQAGFQDAYNNLTYKMSMGYKWISYYCPHAEFVLKLDDDIYVDIFKVIYTLHNFKIKYGPFIRHNVDALRPKSKIFPYIYNQTGVKGHEDFDYLIQGRDFQRRLTQEAKEHLTGSENSISSVSSNQGLSQLKLKQKIELNSSSIFNNSIDLDSECRAKHYTMLDIDPDLKADYERLFPSDVDEDKKHLRDLIICLVMVNSGVLRDNRTKWYASEKDYAGEFYEPYCSGWAVILTPPVAYKLHKAYFTQPYFFIDDAHVTGKLARIAGTIMVNIDYTVHNIVENLDKWVKDDQLGFINSNDTNPWKASSQFKYIFCYNGGNRENSREYWNKTLQGHQSDQSFLLKR